MPNPIVIVAQHTLGVERAKQQITDRFEILKATVDRVGEGKMTWIGDMAQVSAKALGQRAQAQIDVSEELITITIHLPMLLAPFGKAIVTFLEKHEDALQPPAKID